MVLRAAAVIVALLIATVAVPAIPAADSPEQLSVAQTLPANGWIAVRFNVTPESDLFVSGRVEVCASGVTRGLMSLVVTDGTPRPSTIAPALDTWGPFDGVGEFSHEGKQVQIAQVLPTAACYNLPLIYRTSIWPANESVVLLAMIGGSSGAVSLNASWTKGVLSWDVAMGSGVALTREMFDRGTAANTYTFLPPGSSIHAGTSVALALRHSQGTTRDAVGYFAPHGGGVGATAWACSVASEACPATSEAVLLLASKGQARWEFSIQHDARVSALPHYAVMVAELPDSSFLR